MLEALRNGVHRRFALHLMLSAVIITAAPDCQADEKVIATVNGASITDADLQLETILRRVPPEKLDEYRESLIDDLIEHRLIERFLSRRKERVDPVEVDAYIEQLHGFIRRRGEEPDTFLEQVGINEELMHKRLSVSLAWKAYVLRITTPQQLRAYFHQHQKQLDGTQLRARQIFIKADDGNTAARQAAMERLTKLRDDITGGRVRFEDVASEHSEAPSRRDGGDIGFFGYRGTMPASFSDAAFALDVGEISPPIESPFGVHLIKVTDEQPGELCLEDVRPQILDQIGDQLWDEQVALDRPRAKIDRDPTAKK